MNLTTEIAFIPAFVSMFLYGLTNNSYKIIAAFLGILSGILFIYLQIGVIANFVFLVIHGYNLAGFLEDKRNALV